MNFNPFRRRAAEAAEEAAEARANPQLADLELDDHDRAIEAARVAAIVERTRRAREAQVRADDLARRAELLDQAVAEHAATEAAEVKRIAAAGKALEASKGRLCAAAVAADLALAALADATRDHDGLVAQTSAELRAAGLAARYEDGGETIDFATGGVQGQGAVVLAGRAWTRVDVTSVLHRSLHNALLGRLGRTAAVDQLKRAYVTRLEKVSGDLFDAAPAPAVFVPPPSPAATVLAEASRVWHADMAAAHTPSASQLDTHERNQARDELDNRNATIRMQRAAAEVAERPSLSGVFS